MLKGVYMWCTCDPVKYKELSDNIDKFVTQLAAQEEKIKELERKLRFLLDYYKVAAQTLMTR